MARKKKATRKGERGEEPLARKAQFEFAAADAREVYFVGDFNGWDTKANPMAKDDNGIWRATLVLKPGRYEYRFLVDGNWENDPSCSSCVPNEFGSNNCVRIVE